MIEITNTLEMDDGNEYPITLNWARLMRLEAVDVKYIAPYTRMMNSKTKEMRPTEMARILYVGYLCGQLKGSAEDKEVLESAMPEEDFMEILPTDIQYVSEKFNSLLGTRKKKTASGRRSSAESGKTAGA